MAGWRNLRTRRFFSCRNDNEGGRKGNNCEGKPMLSGQVANKDRRSIGSVGNGFDSVQCGSKLDRILRQI